MCAAICLLNKTKAPFAGGYVGPETAQVLKRGVETGTVGIV